MRPSRPSAATHRAVILIAALLLLGFAASAVHSHDLHSTRQCAACSFTKSPGELAPAVSVDPRVVETGPARLPAATSFDAPASTSPGPRGPPAGC